MGSQNRTSANNVIRCFTRVMPFLGFYHSNNSVEARKRGRTKHIM